MAIVVCKVCGKTFSDTREACIHCGTLLKEKAIKQEKEVVINKKVDFNSLDKLRKIRLEEEFINDNKEALSYKQKTTYDKFGSKVSKSVFFNVLFYIVLSILLFAEFNVRVYNETYMIISLVSLIVAFVLVLFADLIEMIIVFVNKRSLKKYIYIKEFQKWLLEKKDINYIPVFDKDSQKEIFDKIDLEMMKL